MATIEELIESATRTLRIASEKARREEREVAEMLAPAIEAARIMVPRLSPLPGPSWRIEISDVDVTSMRNDRRALSLYVGDGSDYGRGRFVVWDGRRDEYYRFPTVEAAWDRFINILFELGWRLDD